MLGSRTQLRSNARAVTAPPIKWTALGIETSRHPLAASFGAMGRSNTFASLMTQRVASAAARLS